MPVSARAALHPSPKSASRYRRGRHLVPVLEGDTSSIAEVCEQLSARATLGAGLGEGDTSSIAEVREQESARATLCAGIGDANNLFVAISATRKGRCDKDMMTFRTKVGESDLV